MTVWGEWFKKVSFIGKVEGEKPTSAAWAESISFPASSSK